MIKLPPKLVVTQEFSRPEKSVTEQFCKFTSAEIVDSLGGKGALGYELKPLFPAGVVAGPAFTVWCGPDDNLAAMAAMNLVDAGDVLVVATSDFRGAATLGDKVAQVARNRGVSAIVTDGLVRDVNGIVSAGVPFFCKGVSPNSPFCNGPGRIGDGIVIDGVAIMPGDLIVGDAEGVVVVPAQKIESTFKQLSVVRGSEKALDDRISAGATDFTDMAALLSSEECEHKTA